MTPLDDGARYAILEGRHANPHLVLGPHADGTDLTVRAFQPTAADCFIVRDGVATAMRDEGDGFFAITLPGLSTAPHYTLRFLAHDGHTWDRGDPYRHAPIVGEMDLYLFNEGTHRKLWTMLGAHLRTLAGDEGTAFVVWAPNAERVSVVGPWCNWDGRQFPMRLLDGSGLWEVFVPGVESNALYKFEIRTRNGDLRLKTDPMALKMEQAPATSSIVVQDGTYTWRDGDWMTTRVNRDETREPVHVYEVHLGSWARVPEEGNRSLTYREIAPRLAEHVKRLGFTHIELLPVMEHPFYGSWGYQVTGYFAPTSRYGSPDDLRFLIDTLHQANIGVFLDWVPAHFPKDDYALRRFDGTALYEHEDPRLGEHPDWGTLIFNYGRREVRNYLVANALYWLNEFHVDGLRVDAVASMLYLDYSREAGNWVPNRYGGRENLEAMDFLREMNAVVHQEAPGCVTIAEDSTAWPGVTKPIRDGGLGFTFKWNMGWMHDTLEYFEKDPIYRRYHQDLLTFAMIYEHSENFVMPLSHDEMVHLKGSLYEKMPGDHWQKLANLRTLFAYMVMRPGKSLLFMGSEIAEPLEWNHEQSLDWHLGEQPDRAAFMHFMERLGHIYKQHSAFWQLDPEPRGFEWIDVNDRANSVLSFIRRSNDEHAVVVMNLTPTPHAAYRIGVPEAGEYACLLSTDANAWGGSGYGEFDAVRADDIPYHGRRYSVEIALPPLSAVVLAPRAQPGSVTMDEHVERPLLRRLSATMGIVDAYLDQTGVSLRQTSDETRERLLTAMGFDVLSEQGAGRALRKLRRERRREWIAPVRVVRQRSRSLSRVRVRVPATQTHEVGWRLTLTTEEDVRWHWDGVTHGGPPRRMTLDLPIRPPLGYHDLEISFSADGHEWSAKQRLIVVPARCTPPEVRLHGKRGFGITTNLYTVRSERNWGAGDIGDVKTIAEWLGQYGGAFVGMNPLHSLRNCGYDVSPYSPITRLFRNPLYIRVEDVPQLAHDPAARAMIAAPEFQAELAELRGAPMLDYERVMRLRAPVMESLHRTFVEHEERADTPIGRAYETYVRREDPPLTRFATYMAISEREGPDARNWPEELRDSNGSAVVALREELAERVDYHRWLQFEIDRQLGVAASDALLSGLSLGMYQDLAVGSSSSGSDVWSHPELFIQGATVGAPPDMYSDEGQNWGLPAINPHALRATGYDHWTRLLRAGFRHTGALRIDHALGMFRMFWVPLGQSAKQGAYMRSFSADLFGILALESVRHNALVVGEDLGTVPPDVPGVLAKWGVLSSKVQVFEREFHTGRFREAHDYPRMALATVNTHDLPPLVGWAEARDIMLRSEVGDLSDPGVASSMREGRMNDLGALVTSLIDAGLLPHDAHGHVTSNTLIPAVHAFIRRTPSALVGLSLDDLAHESTPVNIPGVWQDRYASWSRRMRETVEEIFAAERTVRSLGG